MSEAVAKESSQFEILADGTMIPVKFKPNVRTNTHRPDEVVKVWKLGMAEMPTLSAAMSDEAREISVVCRKPAEWVEDLDDDSFETLIEEGRRLNFTRFTRFFKRQSDLLKAIGQGAAMEKAVQSALEKVLTGNQALGR